MTFLFFAAMFGGVLFFLLKVIPTDFNNRG